MLACAWNSNSTLCVDFYSDRFGKDKATLNIKRYDGCFIEHDQGLLVDIKNSVFFPANRIDELVVDAISLKDHGLHISLLKR